MWPTRIKKLSLVFFLFLAGFNLQAQDAYIHSAGFRGGPSLALSYKRFVWPLNGVLEGILGYNFQNGRYLHLTGLYEHHLFLNYSTNIYGGGGMTLGGNKDKFFWQFDAIVGIEYIMDFIPINISVDYKPGFRVLDGDFVINEFGISLRYILAK